MNKIFFEIVIAPGYDEEALAVLKTNQAVPEETIQTIKEKTGTEMVFAITLP